MGAWIEISLKIDTMKEKMMSHPLWVRGLKLPPSVSKLVSLEVAPFMGAWIEIVTVP